MLRFTFLFISQVCIQELQLFIYRGSQLWLRYVQLLCNSPETEMLNVQSNILAFCLLISWTMKCRQPSGWTKVLTFGLTPWNLFHDNNKIMFREQSLSLSFPVCLDLVLKENYFELSAEEISDHLCVKLHNPELDCRACWSVNDRSFKYQSKVPNAFNGIFSSLSIFCKD